MPLVNARKEAGKLEPGQGLKIMAADRGSIADFEGWARIAKNVELVGQETPFRAGIRLTSAQGS